MITYNHDLKLITLNNGSISYCIYINSAGYLQKVYFGKALNNHEDFSEIINAKYLTSPYYDVTKGEEFLYADGYKSDLASLELHSHGLGDKKYSAIIIKGENGSLETDFKYVSHQIYSGIKPLKSPMPYAKGENCETVEILMKDGFTNLNLKQYITIYSDKDIIVKSFEVINPTQNAVSLTRAMSMQLGLNHTAYDMVHYGGRWLNERAEMVNRLHDGTQEVSSNHGKSSHYENPFVYLKEVGASNEYGEVIGFNLIYSGNFKFRVDCDHLGMASICYGMNDEDFEWNILPNESFTLPQAVISYSYNGVDKMSQNFHKFIRENLIDYKHDKEYKPVLFNSWEGCVFDFNTQTIIDYIDDACKIGTELFVLDDGWFGARNDDFRSLGDWYVNKEKVDLHKVIDYCKQKGIKFGIWFEPEMINFESDLYRSHPEYALNRQSGNLSLFRHQLVLDFSNPEVVDNIYNQMKAFLQEYPVDYIKWDHNRDIGEHYSKINGNNQGEVYHRNVMGYYELLYRLTKEYPHVMIEGCSSGGGRFDMGTLFYCPQIWTSDESNPVQRININYNTSVGYPLSVMGAHVNNNKNASYKEKAILALFGTYGYEMNPNELTDSEKAELFEIANIYKQYHQKVIQEGTLYHVISPNNSNFMCMQCVSKDKSVSLAVYCNKFKMQEFSHFVKFKGLDASKKYINNYDGKVHSGEYLMNIGLNFSLERPLEFNFKLILFTEV